MMTLLLFIIIILLLIIMFWLYWLMRKPQPPVETIYARCPSDLRPPTDFTDRPYYNPEDDALLMLRPGYTLNQAKEYFGQLKLLNSEVKIVAYCQSCDVMLFTVDGLNAEAIGKIVKGQTEIIPPGKPQNPPPPPQVEGELGPVLYGFNYRVQYPFKDLTDPNYNTQPLKELDTVNPGGEPVLVAVLDTGLDPVVARQYQSAPVSHCMGTMGYVGYNMIRHNGNTRDDFGEKGHGTPVTGMILRTAANRVNIKILPVKVLNEKGEGTLLQVMCGIAFAKNAGAKIINASLGFYAQDPGQAYFFKTFIDRMTSDNTLIIAAAGNADEVEDEKAKVQIGEANIRNLDKHLFYPAAYSQGNPNVITVTTVLQQTPRTSTTTTTASGHTIVVADKQNHSTAKVQIGVMGDIDEAFLNPFGQNPSGEWPTWVGSSFAAPKLTGIIAATYYQYLDEKKGWYDREDYLQWLCDKGLLKKKQDVQTTALHVDSYVPHYLLMLNQPEHFIPPSRTDKEVTAKM